MIEQASNVLSLARLGHRINKRHVIALGDLHHGHDLGAIPVSLGPQVALVINKERGKVVLLGSLDLRYVELYGRDVNELLQGDQDEEGVALAYVVAQPLDRVVRRRDPRCLVANGQLAGLVVHDHLAHNVLGRVRLGKQIRRECRLAN